MPETKDMDLVREYADRNSESAFAELVHQHINLVYSVALRFAANEADAKDVTQAVSVILAQKAAGLRPGTILTGWLYETTRFTAMNLLRTKARQRAREQEVYMQSTLNESSPDSAWQQLAPLLEEAMTRLNEKERTLLALRFFANKSSAETAAALGIQEWAARKRVERAVEKLRAFFTRRGVVLSAAVLTGAISSHSIQPAPVALAKSVTTVAAAKGAAAGSSTLTLIKGALKIMAWSKAKTAIIAGAAILLVAGTATVTIKAVSKPVDPDRLIQEGWQLLQAGRRVEATAKFNQVVKSDAKNTEGWNGLGWVDFNSGRRQEAEQRFQKVLTLNPEHPAALNGLGQLYLSQKKYDEAETYLLRASANAPAAWFGLARLYLLEEKYDQAESWARKIVDSGQGGDEAKMMLQAAQDKKLNVKLRNLIEPR
jgi:RNA polymerase sigma factor (sigma-70 family)